MGNSSLDFLKIIWPDPLCEHIAVETSTYARQEGARNWVDTNVEEMWIFLGILLQMDIKIVPSIRDYWSTDPVLGVVTVKQAMASNRFRPLSTLVSTAETWQVPSMGQGERRAQKYTVYACSVCKVRLCKIDCFARFH